MQAVMNDNAPIVQGLRDLLARASYRTFRRALAFAETRRQLSQFYVLSFHALISFIECPELTQSYLQMAGAMAVSLKEREVISTISRIRDAHHHDPAAAMLPCLSTLSSLWEGRGSRPSETGR
jgi:hypothetical protein